MMDSFIEFVVMVVKAFAAIALVVTGVLVFSTLAAYFLPPLIALVAILSMTLAVLWVSIEKVTELNL